MEWQVGQWVRDRDDIGKVERIQGEVIYVKYDRNDFSVAYRKDYLKPFEWQVGKTYKTTLEGVTATIQRKNEGLVYGLDSRKEWQAGPWLYNDKTGLLTNYETATHVPHLLPFLADEPSEHEPTLTDTQQLDPINPQHYRDHPSGIECIQAVEHMTYCLGNAIKYLWRAGKKGSAIEDLKKAAWYVNREIERLAKGGAE